MKPRAVVLVSMVLFVALVGCCRTRPTSRPSVRWPCSGLLTSAASGRLSSVPLTAMFLSDLALEVATGLELYGGWMAQGRGLHEGMWVVYGTVALIVALGFLLRGRKSVFAVTSFAWWAGYALAERRYPVLRAQLLVS